MKINVRKKLILRLDVFENTLTCNSVIFINTIPPNLTIGQNEDFT